MVKRDVDCPESMKDATMDMIYELHSLYATRSEDGIHFKMDRGTVFVRPSGIDHKIRLVVESSDPDDAKKLADSFVEDMEKYISI